MFRTRKKSKNKKKKNNLTPTQFFLYIFVWSKAINLPLIVFTQLKTELDAILK